jgi:hypothetical protein
MAVHREGEVEFYEPGMYQTFQSWGGPVGDHVASKSAQLESLARTSAGFDTGDLIASIGTSYGHNERTQDLESKVGANPYTDEGVGYALWHHEGTKPHEVKPKRPGGVLRFGSRGTVVFTRRVWNPGTVPRKYLTRWFRSLF